MDDDYEAKGCMPLWSSMDGVSSRPGKAGKGQDDSEMRSQEGHVSKFSSLPSRESAIQSRTTTEYTNLDTAIPEVFPRYLITPYPACTDLLGGQYLGTLPDPWIAVVVKFMYA